MPTEDLVGQMTVVMLMIINILIDRITLVTP